ncbi:MAG: amino acid adenylation domain-containing protein [Chloroflexota bacterium]
MKLLPEFLAELEECNIKLQLKGDQLACSAPEGMLTPELVEQLRTRKAELIQFLGGAQESLTHVPIQPIARSTQPNGTNGKNGMHGTHGHHSSQQNGQQNGQPTQQPDQQPDHHAEGYPLSFAQQRLWFLDQLGSSSAYNVSGALKFEGLLDVAILQHSFAEIVGRHEILRTTYDSVYITGGDEARQFVATYVTVDLPVVDLSGLPAESREEEVARLSKAEALRPFDLKKDLMLRLQLLRLGDTDHLLLVTIHHIAIDGWSLEVLVQELATLYDALSQDAPPILPDLPVQYVDYAHWQRNWLQGAALEKQLSYWQTKLAHAPELLALPTDRPRPAVQGYQGRSVAFVLGEDVTEKLRSLARESGATLYMTLLAAFNVLLYRYTDQADLVVGSPIANRGRQELESLLGFFVNTLAVRTNLSTPAGDSPSFATLLQDVRETVEEAFDHQDLPFEKLVETMNLERQMSYVPLVQVLFTLQQPLPPPQQLVGGLQLSPQELDDLVVRFDLELHTREEQDTIEASFVYNIDLFDQETIQRMAAHFQSLVAGIIADPHREVGQIPLVTADERQTLLYAWNETDAAYPQDACLHHLFEAQVAHTPNALAVVSDVGDHAENTTTLTYRELNNRANQLAHHLRDLGVGPNTLVGICVERSLEMVIGILGILKAGGAYVPFDPAYPQERITFMLEDSQVALLLTQASLVEMLPSTQTPLLSLDSQWDQISQASSEKPRVDVGPDNLIYVLYTSGSTGNPKGVSMPHRSMVNLMHWQKQQGQAQHSRTIQFSPISFDVSCQELFSTWHAGGTLYLITEEMRLDTDALLAFLNKHQIERLFQPFVALNQLATIAQEQDPPTSLREIITAGEQPQMTPAMVDLFTRLPDCTLVNQYGPTESHVVTAYTLTGPVDSWPTLPPIGKPIANSKIYILDRDQEPVPIGVPGELYIGGVQVAREYLNRPDLSGYHFIANPFDTGMLYRTGDLCRYTRSGDIEFLGRIDNQVKIRGFRVELGEIEATLIKHDGVRETAVLAFDSPRGKYLAAYVVAQNGSLEMEDLRGHLQQEIPEYMVPATFIALDDLPLTPSGKVNLRALPAPDVADMQEEYVAPKTETEEALAAIWREVFKLELISTRDDFFNLGGHSLLATQVVSRIRAAYEIVLPLHTLFRKTTIAEQAELVDLLVAPNVSSSLDDEEREAGEI